MTTFRFSFPKRRNYAVARVIAKLQPTSDAFYDQSTDRNGDRSDVRSAICQGHVSSVLLASS